MPQPENQGLPDQPRPRARRQELLILLVLAFGIWPIVAVCVVGGYGFMIWMAQLVLGPLGPPG